MYIHIHIYVYIPIYPHITKICWCSSHHSPILVINTRIPSPPSHLLTHPVSPLSCTCLRAATTTSTIKRRCAVSRSVFVWVVCSAVVCFAVVCVCVWPVDLLTPEPTSLPHLPGRLHRPPATRATRALRRISGYQRRSSPRWLFILYICASLYLAIYLFVCLSIYLFIFLYL